VLSKDLPLILLFWSIAAMSKLMNNEGDDLSVSTVPAAPVLFNPILGMQLNRRIDESPARDFSPYHGAPPGIQDWRKIRIPKLRILPQLRIDSSMDGPAKLRSNNYYLPSVVQHG